MATLVQQTRPLEAYDAARSAHAPGTAVRLEILDALSALLDPAFVQRTIVSHFEPLFSPAFARILADKYPNGIQFFIDAAMLPSAAHGPTDSAIIDVRLPRKRKPSAFGLLQRHPSSITNGRAGLAISTFGEVILRAWDWVGISRKEGTKQLSSPRLTGYVGNPTHSRGAVCSSALYHPNSDQSPTRPGPASMPTTSG